MLFEKENVSLCKDDTTQFIMSEKELNSYRLTIFDEPTDEMLSAIMREAAEEAKNENEEADRKFMEKLKEAARCL